MTMSHTKILPTHKYIQDLQLPTDHDKLLVIAPTGSGKTSWAVNVFSSFDMLYPTKMNGSQKASQYGIHFVEEGTFPNDDDKQFGTFDAIHKFLRRDCSQRTLIIDESHHHILSSNENFRRNTITTVFDAIQEYKQVILLTGTPISTTHPLMQDFVRITIEHENAKEHEYYFVTADNTVTAIEGHFQPGMINFVFCNDKKRIHTYEEFFQQKGYKVGVVTADTKHETLSQEIIQNGIITKPYDIIFTTSVVSESVDIYNTNIGSVQYITRDCPALIKQFVSRFRKTQPQVYIYISKHQDPSLIIDIGKEEQALRDIAASKIDLFNTLLNDDMISSEHIVNAVRNDLRSTFTYMYRVIDHTYTIDHTGIAYLVYQKYTDALFQNARYMEHALHQYHMTCLGTEHLRQEQDADEKEAYDTIKQQKKQQLDNVFSDELSQYDSYSDKMIRTLVPIRESARKLDTLMTTYQLSKEQALRLLQHIGRTTQKFNQLLRQLRVLQFKELQAIDVEGTITHIIHAFDIDEKLTSQQIHERLTSIFTTSAFYNAHITETKAVRTLRDFFAIKRCKIHVDERYINGYQILHHNPLLEILQ